MSLVDELQMDSESVATAIIDFIKNKVQAFQRDGIIFGLSGGLDSACIAGLAVKAIGTESLLALIMPERDSSPKSIEDAELVAAAFGIKTKLIDLEPVLDSIGIYDTQAAKILDKNVVPSKVFRLAYKMFPRDKSPFIGGLLGTKHPWMREVESYYRIKHRLRMVTLYRWAEYYNYLVVGTSNLTEALIGFFVKYGDGAADIMPIESLYKTQVRALSRFLSVPQTVIDKSPSPDLLPGITDELAIGITYEKIDPILLGLTKGMEDESIAKDVGVKKATVEYVKKLIKLSEHMRHIPEKWKMS